MDRTERTEGQLNFGKHEFSLSLLITILLLINYNILYIENRDNCITKTHLSTVQLSICPSRPVKKDFFPIRPLRPLHNSSHTSMAKMSTLKSASIFRG